MDLSVPVTHTRIHSKLKLYKTKVYLTHRPVKKRIETSYIWILEAAFDSGSMVPAIFLAKKDLLLYLNSPLKRAAN